ACRRTTVGPGTDAPRESVPGPPTGPLRVLGGRQASPTRTAHRPAQCGRGRGREHSVVRPVGVGNPSGSCRVPGTTRRLHRRAAGRRGTTRHRCAGVRAIDAKGAWFGTVGTGSDRSGVGVFVPLPPALPFFLAWPLRYPPFWELVHGGIGAGRDALVHHPAA